MAQDHDYAKGLGKKDDHLTWVGDTGVTHLAEILLYLL